MALDADGRGGGGILGGPGGEGSGRDEVSADEETGGGRGALVRDDDGCADFGKPLLALAESADHVCDDDGGGTGGRIGAAAPPRCPADRTGPLLVAVLPSDELACFDSHLLGGGNGRTAPFTLRPTSQSHH